MWRAAWAGACPTRRCAVSCRLSRVDKKLRSVSPASTGSVVAGESLSYGGEPLRSSRATPARAADKRGGRDSAPYHSLRTH